MPAPIFMTCFCAQFRSVTKYGQAKPHRSSIVATGGRLRAVGFGVQRASVGVDRFKITRIPMSLCNSHCEIRNVAGSALNPIVTTAGLFWRAGNRLRTVYAVDDAAADLGKNEGT